MKDAGTCAWQVMDIKCQIYSCMDKEKNCQDILLALHEDVHVFDDVTKKVPQEVWLELETLHDRVCAEAQSTNKDLGALFLEQGTALLREQVADPPRKGWCLRHRCMCPYRPPLHDEDEIWIELSGNPCTAWSAAGNRQGWADVHSTMVLVWGHTLAGASCQRRPDLIVNENVRAWDGERFWRTVCPDYSAASNMMGPIDLALPVHRCRKYMALTKLPLNHDIDWLWSHLKQQHGDPGDGSIWFCAPQATMSEYLIAAAGAKGLHVVDPAVQPRDLLPVGARQRLVEYKSLFQEVTCPPPTAFVDLSQNPSYANPGNFQGRRVLPTLKGPASNMTSLHPRPDE